MKEIDRIDITQVIAFLFKKLRVIREIIRATRFHNI